MRTDTKFKSIDSSQMFLLPPSVEDFIPEGHLARLVNEVVDQLDTQSIEDHYSYLGQKSYHPKSLLKLLFYGYATGVRSGRKIATKCESDTAYMYLSCMYHPDFRTINDFRKNNLEAIEKYFVDIVGLCRQLGMGQVGMLIIDSTKIRANAAGHRNKDHKGYQQWLEQIDQQIKELLDEAGHIDEQEDMLYGDQRGDELPVDLQNKQRLKSKIQQALHQLQDEKQKINLTDGDAKFIMGNGVLEPHYNCQSGIAEDGLIVSAYATNQASDREQLIPVLEQAEQNLNTSIDEIIADSGYASYENYDMLQQRGKSILIPDQEKDSHKPLQDPYHRDHFRYDEQHNKYICPQGHDLPLYRKNYFDKRRKQRSNIYRGTQCSGCPVKDQCTSGEARQINREKREQLRTHVRHQLDSPEGRDKYRKRRKIEHIFGNIKFNYQYLMFNLRGLKKVTGEWKLICLVHNLKLLFKTRTTALV